MTTERNGGGPTANPFLARLAAGETMTAPETRDALGALLRGEWTDGEVGAFLTALRFRGATADEILGGVLAMRDAAIPFTLDMPGVVDTCGTGGDGLSTFNISTAAALVVSACGVPVAKHGNRSVTGVGGSADVLRSLGYNVEASPALVAKCLRDLGFGFFYTPVWHPTARRLASLRQRLGFRTLFNLLGPMANPAGAEFQLIGTGQIDAADAMAQALRGSAPPPR